MEPSCCPFCGFSTLERVLKDVAVSAKVDGEKRPVTGMAVYRCSQNAHIFLVQHKDILLNEFLSDVPPTFNRRVGHSTD